MSKRAVAVVFAFLLVASLIPAPVFGQPQRTPAGDNAVTRIQIQEDGDAVWSISIRTRLENESDVEEFKSFQEDFRNNTSGYLDNFEFRMKNTVNQTEQEVNRTMSATNFSASTTIQQTPRQWGVITYTFTWKNFAQVNGNTITVGDGFRGGLYLAEDDILMISYPDSYTLVDVSPEADDTRDHELVWIGPIDFGDERPSVSVQKMTPTPTSTDTPETTSPPSTPSDEDNESSPMLLFISFILLLIVLGGGYYLYDNKHGSGGDEPDETEPSGAEIVTDAERVENLLREHGGRMKQAQIVENIDDWSKSKVSLVLSDMEGDSIKKTRLGRENIIELIDGDEGEEANDNE